MDHSFNPQEITVQLRESTLISDPQSFEMEHNPRVYDGQRVIPSRLMYLFHCLPVNPFSLQANLGGGSTSTSTSTSTSNIPLSLISPASACNPVVLVSVQSEYFSSGSVDTEPSVLIRTIIILFTQSVFKHCGPFSISKSSFAHFNFSQESNWTLILWILLFSPLKRKQTEKNSS